MVKSFLNETKIGNKSKNRVRKEKKKRLVEDRKRLQL